MRTPGNDGTVRASWLGPVACLAVAVIVVVSWSGRSPSSTAGATGAPGAGGAAGGQRPTEDEPDVEQIWQRDCAVCHGADAGGTRRGPSLEDSGRAAVFYMVSTGRMPIDDPGDKLRRREPPYSEATIEALVDHVAELVPGGPDIPDVDAGDGDLGEGGTLYRAQCAACHAWSGGGGALLNREAPPVHPATPDQVAASIRVGPGTMPAFGIAALTDEELASVLRYVQYLDDPEDPGGQPLWRLGPFAEGAIAWVVGIGALLLVARAVGERR